MTGRAFALARELESPRMRHTDALQASRLERIHWRVFGFWPKSFVLRRLEALRLDALDGERP